MSGVNTQRPAVCLTDVRCPRCGALWYRRELRPSGEDTALHEARCRSCRVTVRYQFRDGMIAVRSLR